MSKENTSQIVLFVHMANTPDLNKNLGEESTQSLIKSGLSYLSIIAQQHMGTVIKNTDDGLICTFEDAGHAVEAGKTMHMDIEQVLISEKPKSIPPCISVGLHFGPIKKDEEDVSGEAINVVQKLVQIPCHRKIITTQETIDHFSADIQSLIQPLDSEESDDNLADQKLYEIIWEIDGLSELLQGSSGDIDENNLRTCLELRMDDILIEVDQNNPAITIGRQPHNNLVVREKPVSRTHACIAYREGKFVLIDESSNGTFVLIEGKKMKRVTKDEIELTDNGIIGVGKKADPHLPGIIHFNLQYRSPGS